MQTEQVKKRSNTLMAFEQLAIDAIKRLQALGVVPDKTWQEMRVEHYGDNRWRAVHFVWHAHSASIHLIKKDRSWEVTQVNLYSNCRRIRSIRSPLHVGPVQIVESPATHHVAEQRSGWLAKCLSKDPAYHHANC